jgi:hypothetical protein
MCDIDNLKKIRDMIEKMNKIQQVHILKILKDNKIEYSENSNGIFVNMTLLNNETLIRIQNFIKYVDLQEVQLETFEDIKTKYHNAYYKDNKEKAMC